MTRLLQAIALAIILAVVTASLVVTANPCVTDEGIQ